jgi:hypothetical protein
VPVPFFFDLSSLIPIVERNPFAPVVVEDIPPTELTPMEVPAEPIIDTGLPIPAHYEIDFMRALVQDPFHLFVHWQLKDNPYDRLNRIFPPESVASFQTVLRLIDETNRISVLFDAAFAREYWFSVFPDRTYRVELGVRSPHFGYIKLLSSQPVLMPRGAPSNESADEPEYKMAADDYLQILRDSHLIPERALDPETWLSVTTDTPEAQAALDEALPPTFRRILRIVADIQSGRDYDRLWEQLSQEELSAIVREFLATMSRLGDGELGYMLLLRYLPELLRRVMAADGEIQIDEPISLYLAKQIGLGASEMNPQAPGEGIGQRGISRNPWFPSATI